MPENELFSQTIEHLPIAVVRAGIVRTGDKPADLIVQDVNRSGERSLGRQKSALLEKSVFLFMPDVARRALQWLSDGAIAPFEDGFAFETADTGLQRTLCVKIWTADRDALYLAFSDFAVCRRRGGRPDVAAIHRINEEQEILIRISAQLLRAGPDDLEEIVRWTMSEAAKIATADRVYVFKYDFARQVSDNTYEWCAEGVSPQIGRLQNVPLESMREWIAVHKAGKTVAIDDIGAIPDGSPVKDALAPQEIQSVIAVPLFLETELYGFVGFDSVRLRHVYTPKEEQILRQYGNNLLSAITRVKYERALRRNEERSRFEMELYQTTLLSVGDAVVSTDIKGGILFANKAFERLTGLRSKDVEGKPLLEVFRPVDEQTGEEKLCPVRRVLEAGCAVQPADNTAIYTAAGDLLSVEYSVSPVLDAGRRIHGAVLVFWDVSEKRAALRQIAYLGTHDALTGLLNRHSFGQQIQTVFAAKNLPLSLLIIDVNGLKLTNDAFGHAAGDLLIRIVAQILLRACYPQDLVFRMGGDEFTVLLPQTDECGVEKVRSEIVRLSNERHPENVVVSVAIGRCTVRNMCGDIFGAVKEAEDDMYREKIVSGRRMRSQTIELIVGTINARFQQERMHTDRVAGFCRNIGAALSLAENEIKGLETAGMLHDIGKVIVPQEVLNKPGALTEEEYGLIRRHPETGYQILRSVDDLAAYAEAVLCHHERWDGGGYPQGLKGEEIPLFSRIIAVADAFEAMTAKRVYRDPISVDAAIAELERNAGSQFDPHIAEVFIRLLRKTGAA